MSNSRRLTPKPKALDATHRAAEGAPDYAAQIVSAVSHDLKNPTRQIKSFLQMLEGHAGDDLDAEGLRYLRLATQAADKMNAKLDSLSHVSQANKGDFQPEPCDAGDLIGAATAKLRTEIDSLGANVVPDVEATVFVDRASLETVFQELIRNSLKFCQSPATINIDGETSKTNCRFTVSDSGPGFDAQDPAAAFSLFRRFHLDDYPGAGAGLTIVRTLLARHGSDVTIESSENAGTTVEFSIPIA